MTIEILESARNGYVVRIYAVVDNRRDPDWIVGHLASIR